MPRNFDRGDTLFVTCEHETYNFTNETWTLANPDTNFPKLTIKDPNGIIKVNAITMNKSIMGKYQYFYIIATDAKVGWWRCYIDVENGTYPTRKHFGFEVK